MTASDLIGNTPLIELQRFNPNPRVTLLAKSEGNNPGGSIKDRPARRMLEAAEARGDLQPGMRLLEPTSGNTGIALAMLGAIKGYAVDLVMPEDSTAERVATMRAFGANVILTPASRGIEGSIDVARELLAKGGYFMLDQFSNPDNALAHYETTGPELWQQTQGKLTHFVATTGTTGTLMGVSRALKERDPRVQIVAVQPSECSQIPGIRRWPEAYRPKLYQPERLDALRDVTQQQAVEATRELARTEGVFAGMTSGAAAWIARELCRELREGVVAFVLCDRGDRYLSSTLFG